MNIIEFFRQFTLGGYAIFDLIVSFVGIYLLSPRLSKIFLKFRFDIPKLNWLFLTLPISISIHLIVGNITPMTRDFIDIHSHYFLKILILCLIILGTKSIKKIKKNDIKNKF